MPWGLWLVAARAGAPQVLQVVNPRARQGLESSRHAPVLAGGCAAARIGCADAQLCLPTDLGRMYACMILWSSAGHLNAPFPVSMLYMKSGEIQWAAMASPVSVCKAHRTHEVRQGGSLSFMALLWENMCFIGRGNPQPLTSGCGCDASCLCSLSAGGGTCTSFWSRLMALSELEGGMYI